MFSKMQKSLAILFLFIFSTVCFASSNERIQNKDSFILGKSLTKLVQNYLDEKGIVSSPSIDQNKKFKKCNQPLKIFPVFKSWSTVEIVCSDITKNWNIFIRTRAQLFNEKIEKNTTPTDFLAIIARKSLLKGHILTEEDMEKINIQRSNSIGIFTNIDDLIGRKLKNNISLGFPIRSRHLHLDWVIHKGDKVNIIQSGKTIFISTAGIALENGQKGQKIRVMNLSSEKKLVAWVLNEKKVTTQAKIINN